MNYGSISVEDYSSPVSEAAPPHLKICDVSNAFKEKGYRHMPVVEEGFPVGIISERDISLLALISDSTTLTAADIMVRDPFCVPLGTPLYKVVFEMSEKKVGSALVVDENGKLDSIFTSIDGLNALLEVLRGDV